MSLSTNITNLATRIATECKALRTLINGNATDLSALTTTAKTNLVAAINELDADIAGLGSGGVDTLDELTDVVITTPSTGHILRHNGTNFVNVLGTTHFQPADATLDTLAGFTLGAFADDLLGTADAAAVRSLLGLVIGTNVQAYSAALAAVATHVSVTQAVDLDAIETRVNALDAAVVLSGTWDASVGTFPGGGTAQAGQSYIVSTGGTVGGQVFVANDRIVAITDNASTTTYASNWHKLDYTDAVLSVAGLTGAITDSGLRTALALVVGTDVQAFDADLTAIAALTSAANKLPYATGAGTWAMTDFTAFARTLLDDGDAATMCTTLDVGSTTADFVATFEAGLT